MKNPVLIALVAVAMIGAAWFAGRASVHCPDTTAELERADGDLRRMMLIVDSAHVETARWQYRYDSLRGIDRKPVTQHIHETRHYLRGLGFDALVDSLGARPDE